MNSVRHFHGLCNLDSCTTPYLRCFLHECVATPSYVIITLQSVDLFICQFSLCQKLVGRKLRLNIEVSTKNVCHSITVRLLQWWNHIIKGFGDHCYLTNLGNSFFQISPSYMCYTFKVKAKEGIIRLEVSLGKAKGKDVVSTWYNLYITCRCTPGTDFSITK